MRSLRLFLLCTLFSVLCSLALSGCFGPTYPKEYVDKSIIDLCKKEYGVDVEVKITGNTIGVYIPIEELVDSSLGISQSALRKVDDVVMSVSRVALSTDADFNFYVVVAQDPGMPELELVVIRYVEDVKRFLVTDISRGEYFDRMITEFKFTPQVRTGYIETISDIGYLDGKFFLKDIRMGEFLAKQVEERIRKDFLKNDLFAPLELKLLEGKYMSGMFNFIIKVRPKGDAARKAGYYKLEILSRACDILSRTLYGYKFGDYSLVNISYGGEKTTFTKEELDRLRKKELKIEDIIGEN